MWSIKDYPDWYNIHNYMLILFTYKSLQCYAKLHKLNNAEGHCKNKNSKDRLYAK